MYVSAAQEKPQDVKFQSKFLTKSLFQCMCIDYNTVFINDNADSLKMDFIITFSP